jgi:hypothetical protein
MRNSLGVLAAGVVLTMAGEARAGADISVGSAFVVEPPMAHYLRDLDHHERREQVRDWAVIATVAKLGATPAQVAAATHELPPARLQYLDELYGFEYGRGRRAYLGKRVLLFHDSDDPDPQATIGRLADRVRMESGEIPPKVEIYLVDNQRDEGTIRIERASDITGAELFSPAFGYVEGTADSEADLIAWLDKADDLAHARMDHGRVILGGRRFTNTPSMSVTVEDVAALYQAHLELNEPHRRARATLASLSAEARKAAERLRQFVDSGTPYEDVMSALAQEEGANPGAAAMFRAAAKGLEALTTLRAPTQSPGFSLDPRLLPDPSSPQHPLLLSKLRAFAADPCSAVADIAKRADVLERAEPDVTRRTALTHSALPIREALGELECSELEQVVSPLAAAVSRVAPTAPHAWEYALSGYYQLKDQWRVAQSTSAWLAFQSASFYENESKLLCPRYMGTQGTSVGMTMFYTDLIAKMWADTDYGFSAPVMDIPGFPTKPRVDLDPVFFSEWTKNPSGRIWFAPRANAVSRTKRGESESFYFGYGFSHIFGASSNPANPGQEVPPREDLRRTIGWWDRHFDDVASYEPEYQRLNQIMKWSLVTAALSDANTIQYLGSVRVRRNLTFREWQQANASRLRFSESLPTPVISSSMQECIPLLSFYPYTSMGTTWVSTVGGGVDSVPTTGLKNVAPPKRTMSPSHPKFHVDSLAGNGTGVRAHPTVSGERVVFANSKNVRTRTTAGDVSLGTPKVQYKAVPASRSIELRVGDNQRSIGVLTAKPGPNQVKLAWTEGKVERELHRAPAVPRDLAAADKLAAKGDLITAANSYQAKMARSPVTANELARQTVIHAAQRNPKAVLKAVQQLDGRGAQLLPETREAMLNAVYEVGSNRTAWHIERALEQRLPFTNQYGTLSVERGRIIVTRDIESLSATKLSKTAPTNLSDCEVYLDTRLRVGKEGLYPDTGGPASRWQQRRNVRVEEMKASAIGELPDRIKTGTKTQVTFDHVETSPWKVSPERVIFIRTCDGAQTTATTDDDC